MLLLAETKRGRVSSQRMVRPAVPTDLSMAVAGGMRLCGGKRREEPGWTGCDVIWCYLQETANHPEIKSDGWFPESDPRDADKTPELPVHLSSGFPHLPVCPPTPPLQPSSSSHQALDTPRRLSPWSGPSPNHIFGGCR
ncbi:hyaluronoglucosaminidase 6 isoform X2 [Poecilia reticulata]|uniref:hyaluronoglucosaminidase 6 isoform X2 n=1 Tax=Poecilia reticulata TaxID=8081 RepID=UPI0007E9F697|nr:PREDICTED: uncharacterized protein LOC103465990 isoform X2 [Poecilia reticulata]